MYSTHVLRAMERKLNIEMSLGFRGIACLYRPELVDGVWIRGRSRGIDINYLCCSSCHSEINICEWWDGWISVCWGLRKDVNIYDLIFMCDRSQEWNKYPLTTQHQGDLRKGMEMTEVSTASDKSVSPVYIRKLERISRRQRSLWKGAREETSTELQLPWIVSPKAATHNKITRKHKRT